MIIYYIQYFITQNIVMYYKGRKYEIENMKLEIKNRK